MANHVTGRLWLALIVAGLVAACSPTSQTAGTPVAESSPAQQSAATAVPPAPPAPPPPPSDEDQIRATVQAFQDAYNTQNWDSYKQQLCPAMRAQFTEGRVMDNLKKTRIDNGLTNVKVSAIDIEGDVATVTLDSQSESIGSVSPTMRLERTDGWQICMF